MLHTLPSQAIKQVRAHWDRAGSSRASHLRSVQPSSSRLGVGHFARRNPPTQQRITAIDLLEDLSSLQSTERYCQSLWRSLPGEWAIRTGLEAKMVRQRLSEGKSERRESSELPYRLFEDTQLRTLPETWHFRTHEFRTEYSCLGSWRIHSLQRDTKVQRQVRLHVVVRLITTRGSQCLRGHTYQILVRDRLIGIDA